jgi:hypothetical protein
MYHWGRLVKSILTGLKYGFKSYFVLTESVAVKEFWTILTVRK